MYCLILAELCFGLLLAMTVVMCRAAVLSVKMIVEDFQYFNVLGWRIVLMEMFITVLTVSGAVVTLFLSGSLTILHFYL